MTPLGYGSFCDV